MDKVCEDEVKTCFRFLAMELELDDGEGCFFFFFFCSQTYATTQEKTLPKRKHVIGQSNSLLWVCNLRLCGKKSQKRNSVFEDSVCFLCLMAYHSSWVIQCQRNIWRRTHLSPKYKSYQRGDISTLNGSSLKRVNKFTYFGSSISSTETDINTRLAKAWKAINRQ